MRRFRRRSTRLRCDAVTIDIAIVGAGTSGAILAIHLAAAPMRGPIALIDDGGHWGKGLAYGRCSPDHLLNVPVARLDIGAPPSFADWLGPDIARDAYVPRAVFGEYLSQRLADAVSAGGISLVRGRAVRLLDEGRRGVVLEDGRTLTCNRLVLATGHLPPASPAFLRSLYDWRVFAADPWREDALSGIVDGGAVLLVGTGLTMIDVAASLLRSHDRLQIHAVSRRGLIPATHASGGDWRPFLGDAQPASPLAIGPLTRPAWWEITAIPEIGAQARGLATILTQGESPGETERLAAAFVDLGAGI
jgi:uncharacterized NAD(P)/FAD-binding protein YdhS